MQYKNLFFCKLIKKTESEAKAIKHKTSVGKAKAKNFHSKSQKLKAHGSKSEAEASSYGSPTLVPLTPYRL